MTLNPRELLDNIERDRQDREKKRLHQNNEHHHKQKKLQKAARRDRNESKAQESFEPLRKHIDEINRRGIQGYDTMITASLQVMQTCCFIANGLAAYDVWDDHPLAKMIKALIPQDKRDALADRGYFKEKERIENSTPKNITLPDIKYFLAMSDDGELQMDSFADQLVLSDGSVLTGEQKDIVSRLIKVLGKDWLATKGYVPDADPNRANHYVLPADHAHNATGVEFALTPAVFQRLRDDPNDGLDQFLSEKMGLHLEHAGPRP